MKKILTKKGFTLIELIVVIAILAILAAILIPSITNYINEANESAARANARAALTENALKKATNDASAVESGVGESGNYNCAWTLAGGVAAVCTTD